MGNVGGYPVVEQPQRRGRLSTGEVLFDPETPEAKLGK